MSLTLAFISVALSGFSLGFALCNILHGIHKQSQETEAEKLQVNRDEFLRAINASKEET